MVLRRVFCEFSACFWLKLGENFLGSILIPGKCCGTFFYNLLCFVFCFFFFIFLLWSFRSLFIIFTPSFQPFFLSFRIQNRILPPRRHRRSLCRILQGGLNGMSRSRSRSICVWVNLCCGQGGRCFCGGGMNWRLNRLRVLNSSVCRLPGRVQRHLWMFLPELFP